MAEVFTHVERVDRVVNVEGDFVVVADLEEALEVDDEYLGKLLDCVALGAGALGVAAGAGGLVLAVKDLLGHEEPQAVV